MNSQRIEVIAHKLSDLTRLNAEEFNTKSNEYVLWAKEILVELENSKPYHYKLISTTHTNISNLLHNNYNHTSIIHSVLLFSSCDNL